MASRAVNVLFNRAVGFFVDLDAKQRIIHKRAGFLSSSFTTERTDFALAANNTLASNPRAKPADSKSSKSMGGGSQIELAILSARSKVLSQRSEDADKSKHNHP